MAINTALKKSAEPDHWSQRRTVPRVRRGVARWFESSARRGSVFSFGEITMPKRAAIFVGVTVLVIAALLASVRASLGGPHERVVARLRKKDAGGYLHSVTVRQIAGRFNTELSDEGRPVRDLPVSSYEFYEGSYPITNATIAWPELQKFSVTFDNGITLHCSWSTTTCIWTIH